jgi:hypothetical protein
MNSRNLEGGEESFFEGVSKSFRTGCLQWELQMVQISATRVSCIAILCVSLVSFRHNPLCCFSTGVCCCCCCLFRYDSVRKLLDTHSAVLFMILFCVQSLFESRLRFCYIVDSIQLVTLILDKFVPVLNYIRRYEDAWENWRKAPRSTLDGGEWSALRFDRFTPRERAAGTMPGIEPRASSP